MSITIVNKDVKKSGQYRYFLELTLSEPVNSEWQQAYKESILARKESFTCLSSTGRPTINAVEFLRDKIRTKDFAEMVIGELDSFIRELEEQINLANGIYQSKQTLKKQQVEQARLKAETEQRKLDEINKRLNGN